MVMDLYLVILSFHSSSFFFFFVESFTERDTTGIDETRSSNAVRKKKKKKLLLSKTFPNEMSERFLRTRPLVYRHFGPLDTGTMEHLEVGKTLIVLLESLGRLSLGEVRDGPERQRRFTSRRRRETAFDDDDTE